MAAIHKTGPDIAAYSGLSITVDFLRFCSQKPGRTSGQPYRICLFAASCCFERDIIVIYLDYSSNTPCDPLVLRRFCEMEQNFCGNANSAHQSGRLAARQLQESTATMAELLHVLPEELIYTSGASESNNLALKGLARTSRHIGRHIISTSLEHASVGASLTWLQEQGYEIDLLDIGRDGRIDLDQLHSLLRRDTVLVSLCAVDSELGTIQPIQEAASIIRRFPDCRLHVDATQAIGKIPFSFENIDTVSFAPHKFYGLNGSGILFKRKGVTLEPLIHGGASTTLYRSGTPTLALDVSAETALQLALSQMEERTRIITGHRDRILAAFADYPLVRINTPAQAVPHVINLSVKGVKGTAFQQALDERGICVSVKSACSVPNTPSKAVYAVSRDRKNALCSWRISLSHLTTDQEITEFLAAFDDCYKTLTK